MMQKSICFTGHRQISSEVRPDLLRDLRKLLEIAAQNHFLDYYAGGAVGWDTYCAQAVLELQDLYPWVTLNLILPCSKEEQTAQWTKSQIMAYDQIYAAANTCEFVSETYTKDCMRQRNQRLVDMADCCICYYDADHAGWSSGTAQTMHMAEAKGIPILNLKDNKLDQQIEILKTIGWSK